MSIRFRSPSPVPRSEAAGQGSARPHERIALVLGLLFLIGYYIVYAFFIPPHMDEAIGMHTTACHRYPQAAYNTYREPCDGSYDLVLFDTWRLPLRSYHYAGVFTAVLNYPFLLLWNSYHSYQLLYLLFFIFSVLLLAKLLQVPFGVTLLLSATSFPLFYQFIHDTGPIFFQVLVFLLVPYLLLRMEDVSQRYQRIGLGAMAALSVFLAVEQKPFFIILLPAFCLFCCWALYYRGRLSPVMIRRLLSVLAVAALPSMVLLFSRLPHSGEYYIEFLFNVGGNQSNPRNALVAIFNRLLALTGFGDRVFAIVARPLNAVGAAAVILSVLFWGLCLALLARYVVAIKRDGGQIHRPLSILVVAAVAAIVFVLQGSIWAGHHVIFIYLLFHTLLVVVMGYLLRRAVWPFWMGTAALTAIHAALLCILLFFMPPIHPHSAWDRVTILDEVLTTERATASITVHLSYGLYYIDALYGAREQTVLFNLDYPGGTYFAFDQFVEIVRLARDQKKDVLFLYYDNTFRYSPSLYYDNTSHYTLGDRHLRQYLSAYRFPTTTLYRGPDPDGWVVELLRYEDIAASPALALSSP